MLLRTKVLHATAKSCVKEIPMLVPVVDYTDAELGSALLSDRPYTPGETCMAQKLGTRWRCKLYPLPVIVCVATACLSVVYAHNGNYSAARAYAISSTATLLPIILLELNARCCFKYYRAYLPEACLPETS